ncbi:transmembrane amino acid transporter protein-domain-containing protein [Pseudoneurospora amorphoporcata]|uniref:Transmembrane amino acid transporter protein-domain-containing protein n=1 Tax=Pseudoneurospora amorphoporcata TaxID=241081 RepID=A0AAN6NS21_9PEZI|nr:transmembrane amino acid transporter protein-domain-containing protein [Pseudoneurospora amorphoporcata]
MSDESVNSLTSQERREAEAQVVAEHLPAGYTAVLDSEHPSRQSQTPQDGSSEATSQTQTVSTGESSSNGSSTRAGSTTPNGVESPAAAASSLRLQGGDIHRDLFKLDASARLQQRHRRANTFHSPREFEQDSDVPGMTVSETLAPGGFRRAFLHQKHGGGPQNFLAARMPITRDFVEFLDLYGSFAGEDLADSDGEEAIEDDESEAEQEEVEEEARIGETTALLGRRLSHRLPKSRSATAGTTKTFFTLIKAFVGTGIMFLPKAFANGGLLFSSLAMVVVSAVTMIAFHLLLRCKQHHGGGYGEIGAAISGERMRTLILASITISQLGFVCAGIVFVAENLTSFLNAVTAGSQAPLSSVALIAIQVALLVPLSWIRNISKLGPAALLADACILIGVSYIYQFDFRALAQNGIHKSVVLFNPERYTLMIGSAIFTFEGIGLILPIQSSMAKPQRFEYLLGLVMVIITIVFTSVGALCYATFGTSTQIEIIDNFPQDSKLVNAVQFLYSVAVLVGTPVQLFPALRIIEGKVFGQHTSGKKSVKTKWIKNVFRLALVAFCGVVSVLGTGNLDKFVALIGSTACVPLVYVYPAYLHYKGVATTKWAKVGDVVMMVLGMVCMVYTTAVTVYYSFM